MTIATLNEAKLRAWIGKTESSSDTLHAKQAQLMQLTLDRDPSLQTGDALPPVWHWAYFLSAAPMSQLGRDGHAAVGEFLPPVSLPRRMWAGGRLVFTKPVYLGEPIVRKSSIKDVVLKHGKSGALVFVTVLHEYSGPDNDPRFTEEHDIVYREDPSPEVSEPATVSPPENTAYVETITPSTVQLFRYSALTFNGHRIHYDRDYCKDVEGYPGLIFHGPLAATLLADLAVRRLPGKVLKSFTFRAVAPLFDTQSFTIHHDGDALVWAQTPDGGLAMKASFTY